MNPLASFEPMTFQIRRGVPLRILSCSETKRPLGKFEFMRFIDLYDGPLWRHVRASGFPPANVAAISALYGFLEPGWPIRTYQRAMDEKKAHRICHTGNDVWRCAEA